MTKTFTKNYVAPTTAEEALAEVEITIKSLVRKATRNHYYLRDELTSRAYEGFMKAWNSYDPSRGTKFKTHAYLWIHSHTNQTAKDEWHHMNTHQEFTVDRHDDYYTLDVDNAIDVERKLDKLDPLSLEVYNLRMEGETFDAIADRLSGIRNLQHARNTYLEVQDQLKETY